jgi:hypothetical protein
MWEVNTCRDVVRKPEGKRPLGRPRHKWKDIELDLKKTGWDSMNWFIWLRIGTSGGLL